MKRLRLLRIMLLAILVLAISGCSGKTDSEQNPSEDTGESQETEQQTDEEENETVDIDLTQFSSTVVYSEVYNMMLTPEEYAGQTVRMKGPLTAFMDDDQSQIYTAVFISDATACCQQGFEFVWEGHEYPNDFPELGTEITVTGVFELYERDGAEYPHLIVEEDGVD